MVFFDWNDEKNEWLRQERGVTFPDVIHRLMHGGLLDNIEHPNQRRYPGQKILIVAIEDYVYFVPYVEDDDVFYLKTIVPSRKMTKRYLGNRPE